jgi:hypothetical protein
MAHKAAGVEYFGMNWSLFLYTGANEESVCGLGTQLGTLYRRSQSLDVRIVQPNRSRDTKKDVLVVDRW